MQKILIVEDDEKLRKEFEIFLNNNGYESISLKTFENTLNDILEIKPKLLLLDINLPGIYGEYICKELRKVINISVICLMLFMTITSLSSSIALKNSMQKDMEKMTPVDINLYKTVILKDSEEIINDSKKPISFTLKDNGFDINLLKNIVETPTYEISDLTLEKTIKLNIKNAKMASFKFQQVTQMLELYLFQIVPFLMKKIKAYGF